ncbi:MAG: hypothetical protein JSV00_04755 [bacterium]|nr:MAG: hypothetical protein JSV00_04755 [bacterium]
MKIVSTGDPEIWEARSSGHLGLFLFGLPFLLAGLFGLSMPLGLIPVEGDSGPWYFVVPFGSIFTMVGLGLMTGRRGVIIDRRRHRIVTWYGLLVPMKRKECLLDFHDRLTLSREVRKSDKSTRIVYPVRLECNGQNKPVQIEEPQDYHQARATAESLAEFLRLPLVDRSSGKEVVREPDRLNESVRERVRRTGEEIPHADPPPQMRSTLEEESGTLNIHIPQTGLTATHRLQVFFVLVFITVAVLFALPTVGVDARDPMSLVFVGFFGVGFVLVPFVAVLSSVLRQARRRCTAQASRSLLRVAKGRKVTEIFVDELEELTVAETALPAGIAKAPDGRLMIDKNAFRQGSRDGRFVSANPGHMTPAGPVLTFLISTILKAGSGACIMARSDKTTVRFGNGLSREELFYIYAQLKRVVAG